MSSIVRRGVFDEVEPCTDVSELAKSTRRIGDALLLLDRLDVFDILLDPFDDGVLSPCRFLVWTIRNCEERYLIYRKSITRHKI